MARSRVVTARVAVAAAVAIAVALPALPSNAASPGVSDGGVVASTVPFKYSPNFVDGATLAAVQVGSKMVVGGSFTSVIAVTKAGGSAPAVSRKYLAAFDPATGTIDTAFVPAVNGSVEAIVPTADGTGVYVAGKFTTAGGVATRLALFNLTTGALVTTFKATVNGNINDLALVGSHLLVGGYFSSVGGQVRSGLASVNAVTGAVEPYFAIALRGHHNYGRVAGAANSPVGAISIAVSPDQSRVIVDGNFINVADSVNKTGYARDQIVSINLTPTAATVDANWNSNTFTSACYSAAFDTYMRDIGWSPDGSYFAVAVTGGYHGGSFEVCDAAVRFDAASTGASVTPAWVDYTGTDSIYSVAVTSSAVYVGGHMRWLNNPYGQDHAAAGAVARPGLAALDPITGVPLSWNPGRNPRGHGAELIYATVSGIWVGSDTDWIGNYTYRHQKLAFFPFAGGKPATTDVTGNATTIYLAGGSGASLTANSFDPATGIGAAALAQPSAGGIDWSTVRGAFMLNGRIWYGTSDGHFYYRTYDGTTFGSAMLVDPYNDPYWSPYQTGSKQTYLGMATGFYAELPSVTGMFYANRSIYYTTVGSSRLYRRAFSPDTAASSVSTQVTGGIISPVKATVSDPATGGPVDFSNVQGMFLANGSLWYATRNTGALYQAGWNGTTVTSSGTIDAGALGNWTAPGVFVAPS